MSNELASLLTRERIEKIEKHENLWRFKINYPYYKRGEVLQNYANVQNF